METKSVDVGQALSWFSCGWQVFMKNPGMWIVMVVIYLVLAIVLSLIPFIGALVLALISPALFGGLIYAAKEVSEGRNLDIQHLFQGFKDKDKMTPLLILGAIALAMAVVVMLVSMVIIGGSAMGMMAAGGGRGASMGFGFGMMFGFVVILVLEIVIAMALVYATPLVMLKGTPPIDAIKSSFNSCIKNFVPMLIFGIIYGVVAVIATLPFLLGWIVFGPVSIGIIYCSYKSIYG